MRPSARKRRDALGKALQVLWWIANSDHDLADKEWGVRELGEALGLPPASIHRILTTLTRHGLVRHNGESGHYQVGAELFRLILKLGSRFSLRNAGLPVMHELMVQCNETVFLGLYDRFRKEVMFVAAVHSSHPLRYVVPLGEWFPVYAGASGLSIMAFLPEAERRAILDRGLVPLTKNTITDPVLLEDALTKVRSRGYAMSIGHRNLGAVAIAAPIWGPDGRVVGDLALSIPEARFDPSMEPKLASLVVAHSARISSIVSGGRFPRDAPLENATT